MKNLDLALNVKELTKAFGQLTAVDHVSFQVNQGEFFGFLGPNGAGKTTTIRMLTGIIKKNGGEASVMGYSAGSIRAKQLSGVMPELANAYMDLTAWGNLMLVSELYRMQANQARARASSLLQQLGLFEGKDSKVSTYSMGMRKRLVLALALLSDPQILFLDEPTSGLDVQSVRFMRALLRNLKQAGKTIFLTTHNMDEAAEMCERVAIINGKIVALDSPDKLSITAGRVYLIDVSFDRSVNAEDLSRLSGVNRLETTQAIEAADRLRAQQAMAGQADPGGMGGGQGRMPAQAAGQPQPAAGAGKQQANKPGKAPGAEAAGENKSDNRFRLYTDDTSFLVCSLVDFSRANSLQMNILNIRPPSLEDAFVRLTGEKSHVK